MATEVADDVRVFTLALSQTSKRGRRVEARRELEAILLGELGEAVQSLEIVRDEDNKPQLPGKLLHFNLSHSGALAMVVVSRSRPVGIDVEQLRAFRNMAGVTRRLCSGRERQHLDTMTSAGEDPAAELLRLWVRKEAVVKATGEAVTRDLSDVDVLEESVTTAHGAGLRWRCLDLAPPASGYLAAVAFQDS